MTEELSTAAVTEDLTTMAVTEDLDDGEVDVVVRETRQKGRWRLDEEMLSEWDTNDDDS
ncbi:hypothetical protein F2Q68_00016891 [Brassica cretica]|nr:hypothetical protein F2Q68_00016891 [Brassica cretica]KAF3566973.1 hypothetical protein DY000_02013229 [Brassica cretica]